MTEISKYEQDAVTEARAEWIKPGVNRMKAGDAEVSGATSDDGVIGNS